MKEKYKFHFVFGLQENFNDKQFCYFHYLNLKSCYITQKNPDIYIHCLYEPVNNEWWNLAKDFCVIKKYDKLPDKVYNCNNKEVIWLEHKCDIFRLLILKEFGGVYADIDTIFYKDLFESFGYMDFVMGLEGIYYVGEDSYDINGLCNALIISEPDAEFLNIWLEEFDRDYTNDDWNKFAVRVPYEISKKYSDLIHIEPVRSFHKYNWQECFYDTTNNEKFCSFMNDSGIFSKHMAESKVFHILKNIDRDYFNESNSLYSKMCNNIEGLL